MKRVIAAVLALSPVWACGDVKSDLITGGPASSSRCDDDDQCAPPTPRCNTGTSQCTECLSPQDCGDGRACALPAGSCIDGCQRNDDCSVEQPVCDEESRLCRGCVVAGECPAETPECNAGQCVECVANSDCLDPETPFCSSNRCVECTVSGHCDEGNETCSAVLGECATPCQTPSTCPTDDPICDPDIGFCVECTRDEDCGGRLCRGSECVAR